MKKFLLGGVAVSALLIVAAGGNGAVARDLPARAPVYKAPVAPAWSWAGFYVGVHTGAAVGESNFSDPFGPSIFGDKVTTPGFLAGGQIGYNFQVDKWVYGLEADASWLHSDGTNTCLAFSGFYVSSSCHSKPDALGTVTGRLGYAAGPAGHTLLYAKGGGAFVHNSAEINVNNLYFGFIPQPAPTELSNTKFGWTVGAGVEQALTPAWSVKFEYDYLSFGGSSVATGPSIFFPPLSFPAGSTTSMTEHFHVAKVGLNYKLGADPIANWDSRPAPYPTKAPYAVWTPGWQFEGGARYWYSSGKFQWDNAQALSAPQVMESRLTYDNLKANSGELFGRVDSPWGVFVKGNAGLGRIFDGHMNDEDWGIFGAISYSNTLSPSEKGPISYGTIDAGYDFLVGRRYKVGAFAGYNRYNQDTNTFGCVQIANPLFPCLAPGDNRLVGAQDTHWDSLRVGLSGDTMLFDRFKLSADVAYVPYTRFAGRDDHLLRATTTFFEQQGTGQGVQLEGILSYYVTDSFSIGVGGRYWGMWTTSGTFTCTGCGAVGVTSPPDAGKFNTERFGTFLQGAYKFQ